MGFVKGEPGTEARPPCSDRLYSTEGEPEQPGDLTGATQQRVLVRALVHSGRAYMGTQGLSVVSTKELEATVFPNTSLSFRNRNLQPLLLFFTECNLLMNVQPSHE